MNFPIDNTTLYLFVEQQDDVLVKGIIAWEKEDPENHLYEVEIWWDGKVRIRVLRDSLNLSITKNEMQTGEIDETIEIMKCIKTIQTVYFS